MKNRKSFLIAIVVVFSTGLLFVGAYFLLMNTIFAKPDIYLYKPNRPPMINLSEGVQFITAGSSKRGISYIEIMENGTVISRKYPPKADAQEFLTHFSWVPDEIGVFEISIVAYGQSGLASDPARIAIGVISDGLTIDAVNATNEVILGQEMLQVVPPVSGNSAMGENADVVLGGAGDDAPGGGSDGNDDQLLDDNRGRGEDPEDRDRPPENDLPPDITAFDVNVDRAGANFNFSLDVTAMDDHGVAGINFTAFSETIEDRTEEFYDCAGSSPCEFSKNLVFAGDATYDITAMAVDTIGQNSAVSFQRLELVSNPNINEPGAIAIDRLIEGIVPINFNGLIQMENGVFQVRPFMGAQWFRPDSSGQFDSEDECAPSTIDEATVSVEQYYFDDMIPHASFACKYPCNLTSTVEDANMCVRIEGVSGWDCTSEGTIKLCCAHVLQAQDRAYQDYPRFGMYGGDMIEDKALCGRGSTTLLPVLIANGEIIESGQPFAFDTIPCPPPPPDLYSINTSEVNCGPGDEFCLYATILNDSTVDDSLEHLPIDHYVFIERIISGRHFEEYEYVLDGKFYYDGDPVQYATHEIEVYSVSAEGIRSPSKLLNIYVAGPGPHSEGVSYDWVESR